MRGEGQARGRTQRGQAEVVWSPRRWSGAGSGLWLEPRPVGFGSSSFSLCLSVTSVHLMTSASPSPAGCSETATPAKPVSPPLPARACLGRGPPDPTLNPGAARLRSVASRQGKVQSLGGSGSPVAAPAHLTLSSSDRATGSSPKCSRPEIRVTSLFRLCFVVTETCGTGPLLAERT